MNIYCEDENRLLCVSYNRGKIAKKRINIEFDKFAFQLKKGKNVFLLDEKRFVFFAFEEDYEFTQKIDIRYIEDLVNNKLEYINEKYGKIGVKLFYNIDDIVVDGEKKDYLMGAKGNISFVLKLVYLTIEDYFQIKSLYGSDVFKKKNVGFLPRSLYTITYLKKSSKLNNINILYVKQDTLSLVEIEKGFYKEIYNIPLGLNKLKSIFKDDNILGLYYDSFLQKDLSEFFLKLIEKSLNLYGRMVSNRISQHKHNDNNILLIGNIIKNRYFLDIFSKIFSLESKGLIVPYHFANDLDLFRKNWNFNEVDLLIYLNSFK